MSQLAPCPRSGGPSGQSAHPARRSLARMDLLAQLAAVDDTGWDGDAGITLLTYVRKSVVRPNVSLMGLSGPAGEQAEGSAWAAVWEVLSRPAIRSAASPWGVLWTTARRAVVGEIVAAAYSTEARQGWRARTQSTPGADDLTKRTHGWRPTVSVEQLEANGMALTEGAPDVSPILDLVVDALTRVGWTRSEARTVVEAVAVTVADRGAAPGDARGWRPLARVLDVPPWRVRRMMVFLIGDSEWQGIVPRLVAEGPTILSEPAVVEALRSTALGWLPSAGNAARRVA